MLDLLDDMSNWAQKNSGKKYAIGEVDVFKVENDYELYGAMNINYIKLDSLPKFENGGTLTLKVIAMAIICVSLPFTTSADDDEQPFLMYLSYTAPHDPIQAWPKDIAKYEGVYDVGYAAIAKARYARQLKSGLIDTKTHPCSTPAYQSWDDLSAKEKKDQARVMQVYAAITLRLTNVGTAGIAQAGPGLLLSIPQYLFLVNHWFARPWL